MNTNSPSSSSSEATAGVQCDSCGLMSIAPELLQTRRKSFRLKKVRLCVPCQIDSLKYVQRVNWMIILFPALVFIFIFLWTGRTEAVWWMFALVLLLFCFSPLVVLLHEVGHAVTAKAVGWKLHAIIMGGGKLLWQGRFNDVLLQWHFIQLHGVTAVTPKRFDRWFRFQALLIFAGGPMANMLAGLAGWFLYSINPMDHFFIDLVLKIWILLNMFAVVTSFLPYKSQMFGQKVGSDGYQILHLLFKPKSIREQFEYGRWLVAFATLRLMGEHERAREAMYRFVQQYPDDLLGQANLSAAECEMYNYGAVISIAERGLQLLEEGAKPNAAMAGAESVKMPAMLRAIFQCNLAYAMLRLRQDDAQAALQLAESAKAAIPWEAAVQSTYGYALALTGNPKEGLAVLMSIKDKLADQPQQSRDEHREILKEVAVLCEAVAKR